MSLFISIPIMITELSIGRAGQGGATKSFRSLAKNPRWQWVGLLGVLTAFIIMSFYNVIAGWSLSFIKDAILDNFRGKTPEMLATNFSDFIATGWQPVVLALLFIAVTGFIIALGVTKGIEKANKVMMPLMIGLLACMILNSATLPGWEEGVNFLLKPDFSKITWGVALQALGQSFFSMSLGMGAMIVYGSYIKRRENLYKVAGMIAFTDVIVAIMAGLAIFPAVFSYDIEPNSGAGLVFLTLPNIFAQMTGGYYAAIAFFSLLFLAAITSTISLFETVVSYITEEFKIKRRNSTIIAIAMFAITSTFCAVSQMPESTLKIMGMTLFDFNDMLTSVFMMPMGALLTIIFGGWYLSRNSFIKELSSMGNNKHRILISITYFIIKYIAPIVILGLFISLVI